MKSVAPTKIINWLKKPRSIIANVGIGVAALAVVSVPVVSAYAITTSNNNVAQVQPAAESSDSESTDAVKKSPETIEKTEVEATDNTTTEQNNATPTTPAAQTTEPTTPAAPQPTQYTDTYPADLKNAAVSSKIDQWGLDNRQSTSYTAWKVSEAGANMPKWGYMGKGDARFWLDNATSSNIAQGTTPKVHSVAVRTVGSTGFTAWVEEVNGDSLVITSYNFDNTGAFKQMTVPTSYFNGYIYF